MLVETFVHKFNHINDNLVVFVKEVIYNGRSGMHGSMI